LTQMMTIQRVPPMMKALMTLKAKEMKVSSWYSIKHGSIVFCLVGVIKVTKHVSS
jgi:hypothetical protein